MNLKSIVKDARALSEPYAVTDGRRFRLKDSIRATPALKAEDKPRAKEALHAGVEALADLQDKLYAQDQLGACC